jgi:hypothetical protein
MKSYFDIAIATKESSVLLAFARYFTSFRAERPKFKRSLEIQKVFGPVIA